MLACVLGDGPRTVWFLATIHGDEAAGTPLLERFASELVAAPERLEGTRVVLVPRVNPDGLAADRRFNARGVDLNRNFPAENHRDARRYGDEPLSEPESRALMELLELIPPDGVVSLHQPASCVDFDGPAEDLAQAMSAACGLPVQRLGSRPGSLGSFLGVDRGIPTITLELPRDAARNGAAELWGTYGDALYAALDAGQ